MTRLRIALTLSIFAALGVALLMAAPAPTRTQGIQMQPLDGSQGFPDGGVGIYVENGTKMPVAVTAGNVKDPICTTAAAQTLEDKTLNMSAPLALGQTRVVYETWENTTAAVAGGSGSQYSPYTTVVGRGWNNGASEVVRMTCGLKVLPDQGGGDGAESMYECFFLNGSATPGSIPTYRTWNSPASNAIFLLTGANKNFWLGANTDSNGNISGAGVIMGTTTDLTVMSGGSMGLRGSDVGWFPVADAGRESGKSDRLWSSSWSRVYGTALGSDLSSTGSNVTIVIARGIHKVTGTGSIQTITPPTILDGGTFVGSIHLIPTGAFTTVTGGNITIASTAVVGKTLIMTYDGTAWTPSY